MTAVQVLHQAMIELSNKISETYPSDPISIDVCEEDDNRIRSLRTLARAAISEGGMSSHIINWWRIHFIEKPAKESWASATISGPILRLSQMQQQEKYCMSLADLQGVGQRWVSKVLPHAHTVYPLQYNLIKLVDDEPLHLLIDTEDGVRFSNLAVKAIRPNFHGAFGVYVRVRSADAKLIRKLLRDAAGQIDLGSGMEEIIYPLVDDGVWYFSNGLFDIDQYPLQQFPAI